MVKRAFIFILSLSVLSGCAGNRAGGPSSADYVEIDNPAFTMSPGAPATIWVPRSYVESGVSRGGKLLKKGYDTLRESAVAGGGTPQVPQQQPVATAAKTPAAPAVRNRIIVVEIGKTAFLPQFSEAMKKASAGIVLDQAQAALVARYADVGTPAARSALSLKLQEDFGVNLVIFLSAPDGISPGKPLAAEIYEAQGGSLVRTVEAALIVHPETDSAIRDEAVSSTLQKLAAEVKNVTVLVPRYGRVVSVEGNRVFISAGKESGLEIAQVVSVYRGGKVVDKLGFAPGQRIGRVEVTGFVGTDGSFGKINEGGEAQVSDLVGFE